MKKLSAGIILLLSLTAPKISQAQSVVTYYTSMGNFTAEMYDTLQPITAGNFLSLVYFRFYDGIIFHRVINGFMIQGGDPTGTGNGGPGYTIQDEINPATSNVQKAIAMAKTAAPNSAGSQFFINLVDNLYLNPNYSVFGMVTSNFSVVQAIGLVPVNANNRPLTDVVMDSVRVTQPFVTGIAHDITQTPLIEIYPNPFSENSVIKVQGKSNLDGKITIYNPMGTLIFDRSVPLNGDIHTILPGEISKMNLASGIYILSVTDGKSVAKKKFVVLK